MKFLIYFLLLIVFTTALNAEDRRGNLIIHFEDLRNTKGGIGVLLFNSSKGFPGNSENAYLNYYSTLSAVSHTVNFYDLDYGTYAVSAFHDENSNKKLDTNWLGIPREGVGVSLNVLRPFGAPRFRDTAFQLYQSSVTLNIGINY